MNPREMPAWLILRWPFRCYPERNSGKHPMAFVRLVTMMRRQGGSTDAA
ncbi:hypothetical protein [Microvirga arvi]|nr:hypothetical protein [Microvirga arvi]